MYQFGIGIYAVLWYILGYLLGHIYIVYHRYYVCINTSKYVHLLPICIKLTPELLQYGTCNFIYVREALNESFTYIEHFSTPELKWDMKIRKRATWKFIKFKNYFLSAYKMYPSSIPVQKYRQTNRRNKIYRNYLTMYDTILYGSRKYINF